MSENLAAPEHKDEPVAVAGTRVAKAAPSTGAKIITMVMVLAGIALMVVSLIGALLSPFLNTKTSLPPHMRVASQYIQDGTGKVQVTPGAWVVLPASPTALGSCTILSGTEQVATSAFASGFRFQVGAANDVTITCTPTQTLIIIAAKDYPMYDKGYTTPVHPFFLWIGGAVVGLVLAVWGMWRRHAQRRANALADRTG